MNKIYALLDKFKYGIILLLIFLIPFSLFPFFQNLLPINIVYVFTFGALLLSIISFFQFLISKKLILHKGPIDIPIVIFLGIMFLSFIISSTNKIQALLDPNMGFMIITALSIFYFYGRQYAKNGFFSSILSLSAFIVAFLIIILSLEPSKGIGVIPLDLVIFFGFMFIYSLGLLISSFSEEEQTSKVVQICVLIIVAVALILSFIAFLNQQPTLPSLSLSFKALFETVKNPLTAIFGIGIDNYSVVFTRIKDVGYNQTNLWQLFAPSVDRSTLFHITTTTGMVGLISFLYLIFSLIKNIFLLANKKEKQNFSIMLSFAYLLCVLVIFPPSLLVFFLIFFLASQTGKNNKEYVFNLSKSFSSYSYLILIVTACFLFGTAIRYLGAFYRADYFYTQSLTDMKENNLKKVYDSLQKTLSYNPFLEQYHLGFAKTHFVLAQNIIDKAASGSADVNTQSNITKPLSFTKESEQMLIEAIQTAISENQMAVDLNPKKADYWANFAQIYTIIPKELQSPNNKDTNFPQTIAINLFKKALSLDPNNPVYYFEIGQIYSTQQKFDDALPYIKKAIVIKSNWADTHYLLAMIYLKKNDVNNVVKELEATLQNLDQKTNQKEYDATKQILDKIKNSQQQQQPNNSTQPQNQEQSPVGQPPPQ